MPAPPPSRREFVGVTALSREIGMAQSNITRLMKRGVPVDEIRRRAQANRVKKGLPAVPTIEELAGDDSVNPDSPAVSLTVQEKELFTGREHREQITKSVHRVGLVDELDEDMDPRMFSSPQIPSTTKSYEQAVAERDAMAIATENIDAARLRRAIALADAQEIANDEKRGRLISKDQVKLWGLTFLKKACEILDQMPANLQDPLAAELDPIQVGLTIRAEVYRVKSTLQKLEELWQPPRAV